MERFLVSVFAVAVLSGCAGDGTGLDENGRPLVPGVAVSPGDAAVVVGSTVQMGAQTSDAAGNPTTDPVSWSVEDGTVASVSTDGLVTGINPGATEVVATSNMAMAFASITVVASAGFTADVQAIFNTSCAFANGCHAGPSPQQGQDLSAGNAYASIVNVASMELPTMLRINPGDPLSSYLVHKIRGTHLSVGGQGVRMPFGGQLTQNEIDIVRAWVQNGAPNN